MKRSTVKSFITGIVAGLACLSIMLVLPACSTMKAGARMISAVGQDFETMVVGTEKQMKQTDTEE
jgi:hypothetical protein